MRNIPQTTIEHIEVVSNRSYDQVTASLQERLGSFDLTSGALSTSRDCLDREAGGAEGGRTHRRANGRGAAKLYCMNGI